MVKKREIAGILVTESSGNVFADLGFTQPEEELTKAQLASHIRRIIKRRRLDSDGRGGDHGRRPAEGFGPPQRATRQRAPASV